MASEPQPEPIDEGRRAFLEKAVSVAWIPPAMQAANMAAAGAQTNGSVVSTGPTEGLGP